MPAINLENVSELVVPEQFHVLDDGRKFLCHDILDESRRVIIFATTENINCLTKSLHWFANGTFSCSPSLFSQLFIIHGKVLDEIMVPLVYCLMTDRTKRTYDIIFYFLADKLEDYEPTSIMSDFEIASRNSLAKFFPKSILRGIFFHYMQSIWKHIQSSSVILTNFKRDSDFAFNIWSITSLAFSPPKDVIEGFEKLMKTNFFVQNKGMLKPFLDYFEDTWIGSKKRTRRSSPLYAIELWNVNEAVSEDWDKTNNACESFHRGFFSLLSCYHPTILKLIKGLNGQQSLTDVVLAKQSVGDPQLPRKRARYVSLAERLKTIVESYEDRDMDDYVKAITSNLSFV